MKKKSMLILLMVSFVFLLCACDASNIAESPEQQEGAYFAVFEKLYEVDPGLNGDIEYIAFDLTDVKLEDTSLLIGLFQAFCDNNDYSLLLDDFEGLNEKGYIKELSFPNGILIAFKDNELTKDTLVTEARKWRSGLGAIGAEYTVKLEDSTWSITKIANQWIS